MARNAQQDDATLGIALTAAAGFAIGLVAGIVAGEWLGDVDRERVRRVVAGFKPRKAEPADPAILERAVADVLRKSGLARRFPVRTRALGMGIIELTGTAPDEANRQRAGEAAARVDGVRTVINRILVEGADLPPRQPSTAPTGD